MHESHRIVTTRAFLDSARSYCLDCHADSPAALIQPCPKPWTSNASGAFVVGHPNALWIEGAKQGA